MMLTEHYYISSIYADIRAKKERFLIQLLTFSVDIPYKRIKPSDKWSPGKDIKDKLSGQNFFI